MPELKYWWARKTKEKLKDYEMKDGSLNLEAIQLDRWDLPSRLSGFQKSEDEDFKELCYSYFIHWRDCEGKYSSHESARDKIQRAYSKNKNNLLSFLENYVPKKSCPIKDVVQ